MAARGGGLAFLIIDQREGLVRRQAIMALERRPDVGGCQFAAGLVGKILDNPAEIRLHPLGEFEALVLLQDPCDAALAGLAVDADPCLLGTAYIRRLAWTKSDVPSFCIPGL